MTHSTRMECSLADIRALEVIYRTDGVDLNVFDWHDSTRPLITGRLTNAECKDLARALTLKVKP